MRVQRMWDRIPRKALSPLQPYLAIYGMFMSTLLSMLSVYYRTDVAIFQGYLVFTRYLPPSATFSWGYGLPPWIALGLLCLMCSGWLVYGRTRSGWWSLRVPKLHWVNVHDGMAEFLPSDVTPKGNWFQKGIARILDSI